LTGIVAIIARDRSDPVQEEEIEALARTYESLRGTTGQHGASAGRYARVIVLGTRENGRPEIERAGDSWAASIGTVHHDGPLPGTRPDDLEGHFGLISHDAATESVLVATDPVSLQPVYKAERGQRTYVSDSALVLAKHLGANPSRLGLLTFLRTGYHFGTMTNWEGVVRLEPGGCLTFTPSGTEEGSYWRPKVDEAVAELDFDEAVEHTSRVALETCQRWLAGRNGIWADLTGGFDSRLLALLLDKLGIPFDVDTRGDYTDDRRLAGEIARVKGWRWLDLLPPPDWSETLPQMVRRTVAWSDGHLDPLELSWVLWAHSQMREQHPSVLYAGGGEHLRGYTWRQEWPRAGKTRTVNFDNWLDLRLIHPMNMEVFAEDPTPEVRADMLARMKKWVAAYESELNTTQCDLMFLYKMTGHFGIYRSADAAFIQAEVPLYSKQMYTTAISLNYRHRRNHRLVRHMIWRLDPRAAAIETDSGGPAEPWRLTNLHRFVPYYAQLGRKAVNKVGQKFLGRRLVAPLESGNWWCPPEARRAMLSSLGGNGPLSHATMRSAALFDGASLGDFLARAREDDFDDASLLGRILAVEVGLQTVGTSVEES
jgi:asparagine synthetase B (glutamine-hydrolysing)